MSDAYSPLDLCKRRSGRQGSLYRLRILLRQSHSPSFLILGHCSEAHLKLRRAFHLLGPDHAELHLALPVENGDFLVYIQFAAHGAKTSTICCDIQRMHQFLKNLASAVLGLQANRKNRFHAISAALNQFSSPWHLLPETSLPLCFSSVNG